METDLDELRQKLHDLEDELERKIQERRQAFEYRIEKRKVIFEQAVLEQHKRLKVGLLRFLRSTRWSVLIEGPMTYALIVPLALLDLFVSLYQAVCFPIWGITRVRRSAYIKTDRRHLAYLNALQKLNCVYCGYANGLLAYVREVAGRTEQYWCPIKHALRVKAPHRHYADFLDYGDALGFRDRLSELRAQLKDLPET